MEAAQIGATIEIQGKTYPFRPAALNYYRGSQSHANGLFDNLTFKMINMLVGNIDVPGGHLGVPLDHRGFFVHPGEDGMLKPEPHQLHPAPPFKYPPDSTHLMEWFPIGFDAGQLNTETLLEPKKFGLNYEPEAVLLYHSNPLWNLPETDKVEKIMAKMKFVVAIDIQHTESTQWADVFLPAHTYLESYLLNCLEPPAVTGHSLRQPVVEPVGDTRDAYDILTELAERIGFRDDWNDVLNMVCGYTAQPKYLLDPEKRYSMEEFWDQYARSVYGDDKGLEWFKKHGHAVRYRTPEETYMPYGDLRIPFYFEFIQRTGDDMRRKFTEVGLTDWPSITTSPCHSGKIAGDRRRESRLRIFRDHVQGEPAHFRRHDGDAMALRSERERLHPRRRADQLSHCQETGIENRRPYPPDFSGGKYRGTCPSDRRHSSAGIRSQQHPDAVRCNQRPGEGTRYALQPAVDGIDAIYGQRHGRIGIDSAGASGTGSNLRRQDGERTDRRTGDHAENAGVQPADRAVELRMPRSPMSCGSCLPWTGGRYTIIWCATANYAVISRWWLMV